MDLHGAADIAAKTLMSKRRWFLHADTDADGICASAVLAIAMMRAGRSVQVRHSRDKDAAAYEALADVECDGLVLLDKGSSHLDLLADIGRRTGRPVVVIDHHGFDSVPDDVVLVNPRNLGMDGSRDASAATTAMAVALALDEGNMDIVGIALAGAIGDWQHRGGWQGWNKELVEQGIEQGRLHERQIPAVIGADLADGLTHTNPPMPAIHSIEDAHAFLQRIGIQGADVEALDDDAQGRLLSAMTLHHLAHGSDPETLDRLAWDMLHDPRTRCGVRFLFRRVDACGRTGRADDALALLLGDQGAAEAVDAAFLDYSTKLSHAIRRLAKDGTDIRQACQIAWTDDPALTGMVGGIGMTHVLQDRQRPAVVLAKRPDGDVQVSTRGTNEAVGRGLALGDAVRTAAAKVGRDGGGHPVAAGTVLDPADVDAFLAALDEALVQQGFLA